VSSDYSLVTTYCLLLTPERKPDRHQRPLTLRARERQASAVLAQDGARDRQAKPGAIWSQLPRPFPPEKSLEDPVVLVPLQPEHRLHLFPLLAGVVLYKLAFFALIVIWPSEARRISLATLGVDLGVVFVLVWFTGGGESHFYLLFYPLVALDAYYFGPRIGTLAATLSSGLMAVAGLLTPAPLVWAHVGARAALLGLLGLALGHISERERAARARAEALNAELRAAAVRPRPGLVPHRPDRRRQAPMAASRWRSGQEREPTSGTRTLRCR